MVRINKHCFLPYEVNGKFKVKAEMCVPDHTLSKQINYLCKFSDHLND
jgi:hypothetical protein